MKYPLYKPFHYYYSIVAKRRSLINGHEILFSTMRLDDILDGQGKFGIRTDSFGRFTRIRLINKETGEYASIIPEFGANVNEIVLQKKGKKHSILDGDKTQEELTRCELFKGAKLTPWPNRIRDGRYVFQGKEHQLPTNFPQEGHAIHGLVYNRPFNLVTANGLKNAAKAKLEHSYDGSIPGYPFKFKITILYILSDDGFTCKTSIKNNGEQSMPVGDGWHPYFRLGKTVDDLMLKIPAKFQLVTDERMIPNNARTFRAFRELTRIGDTNFDTGFIMLDYVPRVELYDPKQDVTINAWQETGSRLETGYKYVQIFIPPSRKSIAIEPMTCPANGFNSKQGIIILEPGEEFKGQYGVKLS